LRLEVPMGYFVLVEIKHCVEDLPCEETNFIFREFVLFLEEFRKIGPGVLHDDDEFGLRFEALLEADDVIVVDFSEKIGFRLEIVDFSGGPILLGDALKGHCLVVCDGKVDLSEGSLPDDFFDLIFAYLSSHSR
jgi:hypothetical protein